MVTAHRKLFWASLLLYGAALVLPACRVEPLMSSEPEMIIGVKALVDTLMACFWQDLFAVFFAANLLYAVGLRQLWAGDVASAFLICFASALIAGAGMLAFAQEERCVSFEMGSYAWLGALVLPGLGGLCLPARPPRGQRRPLPYL